MNGRLLGFRVPEKDLTRLDRAVKRLDLSTSEVARRALRLGLETLEKAKLPGRGKYEATSKNT